MLIQPWAHRALRAHHCSTTCSHYTPQDYVYMPPNHLWRLYVFSGLFGCITLIKNNPTLCAIQSIRTPYAPGAIKSFTAMLWGAIPQNKFYWHLNPFTVLPMKLKNARFAPTGQRTLKQGCKAVKTPSNMPSLQLLYQVIFKHPSHHLNLCLNLCDPIATETHHNRKYRPSRRTNSSNFIGQ